jgi:HSP20 family protein
VYETEAHIVVQVEIAGVRPEDFRIALFDRQLTITGVRADTHPEPRAYHQMEVHFGEFRTDVDLPGAVEREHVEAEYGQGFLRVILPRQPVHRVEVT